MTSITIDITRDDLVAIAKQRARDAGVDVDALTLRPLDGPGVGIQIEPAWWDFEDSPDGRTEALLSGVDPSSIVVTFRLMGSSC